MRDAIRRWPLAIFTYLILGAFAHLALYGDHAWTTIGSLMTLTFWPIVILWMVVEWLVKIWLAIAGLLAGALLIICMVRR